MQGPQGLAGSCWEVLSKNEKGPPCSEPKSLIYMVPAPGVEPGTY